MMLLMQVLGTVLFVVFFVFVFMPTVVLCVIKYIQWLENKLNIY